MYHIIETLFNYLIKKNIISISSFEESFFIYKKLDKKIKLTTEIIELNYGNESPYESNQLNITSIFTTTDPIYGDSIIDINSDIDGTAPVTYVYSVLYDGSSINGVVNGDSDPFKLLDYVIVDGSEGDVINVTVRANTSVGFSAPKTVSFIIDYDVVSDDELVCSALSDSIFDSFSFASVALIILVASIIIGGFTSAFSGSFDVQTLYITIALTIVSAILLVIGIIVINAIQISLC